MMHFVDAAADGPWLAELREAGLLAPHLLERIDAALGRPETGTLDELLLAGADWIPERAWLAWMIRRHGCHRFGSPAWTGDLADLARGGLPAAGNLPYLRCPDGTLLTALFRPDRREATLRGFQPRRLAWAAATPAEVRELRAAWSRAGAEPHL
jgi:hypothetical protein